MLLGVIVGGLATLFGKAEADALNFNSEVRVCGNAGQPVATSWHERIMVTYVLVVPILKSGVFFRLAATDYF